MITDRSDLGREGECFARRYLEQQGMTILAANFRTRRGEIDLIAQDADTVVFVEVKTRSGTAYGFPVEAVTLKKQRQISRVALQYLDAHTLNGQSARFDVVSLLVKKDRPVQVEHIKNAFELSADYA